MTPLFVAWLLALGASVGVMATLTFQWWADRRIRRVEMDNYTARLRALDRPQPKKPSPVVSDRRVP